MEKRHPLDPRVLHGRLPGNTIVGLLLILTVCILDVLFCTVPSVHRLSLTPNNPNKPQFVQSWTLHTLHEATGLQYQWSRVDDRIFSSPTEQNSMRITLHAWKQRSVDSLAYIPAIDTTHIHLLKFTTFPHEGILYVDDVPDTLVLPDNHIDERALAHASPLGPTWVMEWPAHGGDAANRVAVHKFFHDFLAINGRVYPGLREDSLVARTFDHVYKEERDLHALKPWSVRLLFLCLCMVLAYWTAGFIVEIRNTLRVCHERRAVYTSRGTNNLPSPSFWWCLWAMSHIKFILCYEESLRQSQRQVQLARRHEDRRLRQDADHQRNVDSFEDRLQAFLDQLPAVPVSEGFEAALTVAMNNAHALQERSMAFATAMRLFALSRQPRHIPTPSVTQDVEDRLRHDVEVACAPLGASTHRRTVEEYVARANAPISQSQRVYWLERALNAARGEEPLSTPPVVVVAPTSVATNGTTVTTVDDFPALLGIREFIPSILVPEYVEAIILHGLMRPTQRGRAAFKGPRKGRYYRPEVVRSGVVNAVGRAQFRQDEYETALHWLLHEGVVVHKYKSDGRNLALNSRPEYGTTPTGREIVNRVIRCYRQVVSTLQQ